jgi:microcystin-dependent protein
MAPQPFLGEIRIFAGNFAPSGWALCNGQLLAINQYQALFSLLGTLYGGDGRATFALPNLQGRTPFHTGGALVLGQSGGEAAHELTAGEMPRHSHTPVASGDPPDNASPANSFWANSGISTYYSSNPNVAMADDALASAGGNQPHENLSPYLVLNFMIAIDGTFPIRS